MFYFVKAVVEIVKVLNKNDGRMMWRDLVKESGYCGKGLFHKRNCNGWTRV